MRVQQTGSKKTLIDIIIDIQPKVLLLDEAPGILTWLVISPHQWLLDELQASCLLGCPSQL